jgi:hypothetical protein
MAKTILIGCAAAYWGDSSIASPQLVRRGPLDYLVYDYLAEVTMSILVRQRAKDPSKGYATDFIDVAMSDVIADVAARGIKVLSNAGGVNPHGCAEALRQVMRASGVDLKIAVVVGDQVDARIDEFRESSKEMFTGAPLPTKIASANAYLGAIPVAEALAAGAQIVITGRCADSALALGALMHEFGWATTDYDRLAAGSMVGHLLECGPQVTGGMHTDWQDVDGWADIGYPIAECHSDGSFVLTKHHGTGGLVSPATVSEQLIYETGDPAIYILPDVICDLTGITLEAVGPDRVQVTGARGRPPTTTYKVGATYQDGWRAVGRMISVGADAPLKAQRAAEMILARTRNIFRERNLGDYRAVNLEILGTEAIYGPHARVVAPREVTMRLSVEHEDRRALEIFSREVAPSSVSSTPALLGGGDAGRPKVTPVVKLFSFLIGKDRVPVSVEIDGKRHDVTVPSGESADAAPAPVAATGNVTSSGDHVVLPLVALAYARSGDKGDTANIGVIARHPELLSVLRSQLTAQRVKAHFVHLVYGDVCRYELPGVSALNFVMTRALGGGGMASMRYDPLGKSFAQLLLDESIEVPVDLVRHCRVRNEMPADTHL